MFKISNWKLWSITLAVFLILSGIILVFKIKEFAQQPPAPAPIARETSGMAKLSEITLDQDTMKAASIKNTLKIIKSAKLEIVVESVKDALEKVQTIAETLHGYVSYTNLELSASNYLEGETTLKVPSNDFDQALNKIEKLGRLISRNIKAEDVSEEYMDLDTRLRNLKKQEESLVNLFNRTGKIQDILEVERELSRVRTDAERIEGQLRYLDSRVNFSTIHITLSQIREALPQSALSFTSVIKEAWNSALSALAGLASVLLTLLVWIIVFMPAILIVIAIIAAIKSRLKKR